MKNLQIQSEYYDGGTEITLEYTPDFNNKNKDTNKWLVILSGVIIGFVNGFWGGGGGMICVPILINLLHLPEKQSHATTLLIMLPLSIASLIVYLYNGNLPINDSLTICIGFVIGGLLGATLLKKINNFWLGIIFSLIIIAGGIKMLL